MIKVKSHLEITMVVKEKNRESVSKVYYDYKESFLKSINGTLIKDLLVRDENIQVLHGFDSIKNVKAYLSSDMLKNDVFVGLQPL